MHIMKLFLTGGFLGSGKTTAIRQACKALLQKGIKVAVITNDQGTRLVDTGFLNGSAIPVREVTNGCFCCHFHALQDNMLALLEQYQPGVIFAESVGSCTDLVATVVKPLQQFHPRVAVSLSVFADATTLAPLLKGSRLFVDRVKYIYQKQLEEADLLILNKTDLLTAAQLEEAAQLLKNLYPDKPVLRQNAFDEQCIWNWIETAGNWKTEARKSLELDYEVYGAGEAELAWFDAALEIKSRTGKAMEEAYALINNIISRINRQALAIGHVKFLLDDGVRQTKVSITSHQSSGFLPEEAGAAKVAMLINARVQAAPGQVEEIVVHSLDWLRLQTGCVIVERTHAAFQPGYPKPTYRIVYD